MNHRTGKLTALDMSIAQARADMDAEDLGVLPAMPAASAERNTRQRDDVRDYTNAELSRLDGAAMLERIDEAKSMEYADAGRMLDQWAAARSARIATRSYQLGQEIHELARRRNK